MVMPDGPAMPTIASGVIGSATIHVVLAAHVIHAGAVAGHRGIVPTAPHVTALTLIHRLCVHWLGVHRSTPPAIGLSRARPHLCEDRSGQRQRTDGGKGHNFHGISPRNRRGGARMMDDWRRRMFRRRPDRLHFDKADPGRRIPEMLSEASATGKNLA
jgi:hypothetical protein